jgi:hypothetical protein
MAPDLPELNLRQRAERLLRAFDFARCAGYLKRYGCSAGNAAARHRDLGGDEHDLRASRPSWAAPWRPNSSLTA